MSLSLSYLFFCPHLYPILFEEVLSTQENFAAVRVHCLQNIQIFGLVDDYIYYIQYISNLFWLGHLPCSVWACQTVAGHLWLLWRFDPCKSFVSASRHTQGRQGLDINHMHWLHVLKSCVFCCGGLRRGYITSSYEQGGVVDLQFSTAHFFHPPAKLQRLWGSKLSTTTII